MGALDHIAGFAKEAEAELALVQEGAVEGLKKEAEAQGIEITDEQAIEILKEAGFWSTAMKPRKLWRQDKLLKKFSPKLQEKLLTVKHMPPLVPYEGSLFGNLLVGSEKAIVGGAKAIKGGAKAVKGAAGLPKTIAHGVVKIPRVVKETVQRAVKKGPEQKESLKKLLAALGIGTAGAGVVAGGNVARKKLWGDKSVTPFGSTGEWGGVLGSRIEKKDEEEEIKAAMVNPLMAGIPLVTGSKSKDKDWDVKKSLILGAAAGILMKTPIFKPMAGKVGVEKMIQGGITGGVLGGAGHALSSLFRKKEPEEVA